MIIDNENENLKVHQWIAKYTEEGTFDIVTGYFTIGALAYISRETNNRIQKYRMVLGDIVNIDTFNDRPLDLLNENITIEAALKLNGIAKEAVKFLKEDKVEAKTLEPNFCHAKAYIFKQNENDPQKNYFISGSSNLTEAGIGQKVTNNVELNIASFGSDSQYSKIINWFEVLWNRKNAHKHKTLIHPNGKKEKVDFKEYLISEIERIFIKYTPREIYYKILFELFGNEILEIEDDPNFNRQLGRLENSVIYNSLYKFQRKGVLSLIRMLQKYDGAILADAVGLGKTWSALAVIKFFQLQGRETILLCPKKLEHNWRKYRLHQDSKFEKDKLDYFVRFHTDMYEQRLEKYGDRADSYFQNDRPKLLVIDESHNLRNSKSNRYKFLMENIIKPNDDIKVLLLSATPINNSLNDIRNQFSLMVKGNPYGYYESLGVRNIDFAFRSAQRAFNEWRQKSNPVIGEFIQKLPDSFFTLTDSLTVARTRKMIEGEQEELVFPTKTKPLNLFVTPTQLGNFESFEELFEHFPPMLSGYQPSLYLADDNKEEKRVIDDEKQRDRFLVKMMYILMVKRLESSWTSFHSTVKKIQAHHQNALNKIIQYQDQKVDQEMELTTSLFDDDDLLNEVEELTLGKKRKVSLRDIDEAGNLDNYKEDLKKDIHSLDNLVSNLDKFQSKISKETISNNNIKSDDSKLEELINQIREKRHKASNNNNQKLVIFTVYRDTAEYLYDQLINRGFDKVAMVSGSGTRRWDTQEETKNFEPILERFAPYTKLYKEKEWNFDTSKPYKEWLEWVSEHDLKTYNKVKNPIDILIATDSLSEGQNLQDADMVINYDIHWNPVRIIQRLGRIDRLGSPNKEIFSINFWPSNNINSYLNLQGRIEERMAAMKLAGSEVDEDFSESFKAMAENESLDQKMKDRMMRQMELSLDDLDGEESFGFDDLSLERYRQELLEEFNRDKDKYKRMPKGVYSGFKAETTVCTQDGIVALLAYPTKPANADNHTYTSFDLIYIDENGERVLANQKEVLDAITFHKDFDRYVPAQVDKGDEMSISKLVTSLKTYLKNESIDHEIMEDGSIKEKMGSEVKDVLSKLKKGNKNALSRIKEGKTTTEKYQLDQFDLITWLIITI
jgi:ERCC4-related helicase